MNIDRLHAISASALRVHSPFQKGQNVTQRYTWACISWVSEETHSGKNECTSGKLSIICYETLWERWRVSKESINPLPTPCFHCSCLSSSCFKILSLMSGRLKAQSSLRGDHGKTNVPQRFEWHWKHLASLPVVSKKCMQIIQLSGPFSGFCSATGDLLWPYLQ